MAKWGHKMLNDDRAAFTNNIWRRHIRERRGWHNIQERQWEQYPEWRLSLVAPYIMIIIICCVCVSLLLFCHVYLCLRMLAKLGSSRIMYEQHQFLHFVGNRFVKWYWQRRVHTSWCFMHYICLSMFIYLTPKANNQIYCWVVLYLTFWTEKSTTLQCTVRSQARIK